MNWDYKQKLRKTWASTDIKARSLSLGRKDGLDQMNSSSMVISFLILIVPIIVFWGAGNWGMFRSARNFILKWESQLETHRSLETLLQTVVQISKQQISKQTNKKQIWIRDTPVMENFSLKCCSVWTEQFKVCSKHFDFYI